LADLAYENAQYAKTWADNLWTQAQTTGDTQARDFWAAKSRDISDWADRRTQMGNENWIKSLSSQEIAGKLKLLGWAGAGLDALSLFDALDEGNNERALGILTGMIGAWAFGIAFGLLFVSGGWVVAAVAAGIGAALGQDLGQKAGINILTSDWYAIAQQLLFRRDPLTLDLDGDGLETVSAAQSGVLFDHAGDGIREGTGWVLADDGFMVLDRNANGTIDTGAELFGDSTPLSGGGTAADGFAALAQEDTNSDGVVNASDARFSDLRIWRDLNQDGNSQAGELFSLASLGIASINVAATENSQVLSDGNRIADLGTFTRTDGSSGTAGSVGDMADIDLSVDTFHREFTTPVPLVTGVTALPNMQGSGKVRDLWEAASLSPELFGSLSSYSAASTRAAQLALIDELLGDWSASAGMPTMSQPATSALATAQNPYGYGLKWESIEERSRSFKRRARRQTGNGCGLTFKNRVKNRAKGLDTMMVIQVSCG
jgi:hypothetical protein